MPPAKGRKLAADVWVGSQLYPAGSTPPKEVEDQIDNPAAWGDDSSSDGESWPFSSR